MQRLVAVLVVLASAVWLLPSPSSAAEPSGQWREKTELVPDEASSGLVRRSFRVWDTQPELQLEFSWRPADESGKEAGAVTGAGELIWYPEGASAYDRRLRYSRYVGSLKDGRPHGNGKLSTRDRACLRRRVERRADGGPRRDRLPDRRELHGPLQGRQARRGRRRHA